MLKLFSWLSALCLVFGSQAQNSWVIADVNVIPMDRDTVLKHRDVYIQKGIIISMVKHGAGLPKTIPVINASGKYLMPGLVDMHVHLPDGSEPIGMRQVFDMYLQCGVTGLRSMRGEAFHPALRDSINAGYIKAPNLYISNSLPYKDSLLSNEAIAAFIDTIKTRRYDFIKYLGGIGEERMSKIAGLCRQEHIVIAGHAYKDLQGSIRYGFRSVEHIGPLVNAYKKDSLNIASLLDSMVERNITFCPTASWSMIVGFQYSEEQLHSRYGMNRIDTALLHAWDRSFRDYKTRWQKSGEERRKEYAAKTALDMTRLADIMKLMQQKGVNVVLSPDNAMYNVPGYAMYEEMKIYQSLGMSPYQVLRAATHNAAVFFDQSKWWGSVSAGKNADLVLLDKNPLENLENIKTVNTTLVHGQILYRKNK